MKNEVIQFVEPASQVVNKTRWQLLEHILRMNDQVPAKATTIEGINKRNEKTGKFEIPQFEHRRSG